MAVFRWCTHCAAAAGGSAYNAFSRAQTAASAPPTPVKIARAAVFDVPHVVEVVGTVDSLKDTLIRTQVEGVLTAINSMRATSSRPETWLPPSTIAPTVPH
nr:hypothetical protein [Ensifer sp. IC4062]